MKPSLLYKISSILLAFFGITHTFGLFLPQSDTGAQAVVESMRRVHFEKMGFTRSYWEFYLGFGILATIFLLFSAILAWQLGNLVKEEPKTARTIAWPFAVTQVAVALLCWTNFFYAPAITATLIAVCLLYAALVSVSDR